MFAKHPSLPIRRHLARLTGKQLMLQRQPRPIVSFTFDDFPVSALRVGGSLLSERNLRGTYYTALGLSGRTTAMGEMFKPEDLRFLLESGHELACHTYGHVRACDVSAAGLANDCKKNLDAISEMCGGYQCENFSFPEGVVSPRAKATMLQLYGTCRTVEPGINVDPVDFGFLRANPVYSTIPIRKIEDRLRENRAKRGWTILYTHDICADPSIYGCTPAYFQEVLQFAVDSGAEILTVAQAAQRFYSVSLEA